MVFSFLPHRQLRNAWLLSNGQSARFLPHRQLRNYVTTSIRTRCCFLPHRQLRKKPSESPSTRSRFLPHRQLRKSRPSDIRCHSCFLPHRQLRTCSQSVRGRKQRGLGWAAALQTSRRAARPACGLRLTVHPGSRSCAPHGQIMNRF